MQFGLLGKSLSHSFSKKYFEEKFNELGLNHATFKNYELQNISEIIDLVKSNQNLLGLSVTLPYKESIIKYCDEISHEAKIIGAVNCIKIKNQKLIGYNTDAYGFAQSIKPFLDNNHQRALILGTGGASKAVAFALKNIGLEIYFATSTPSKKNSNIILYSEINDHVMQAFKLLVNTTPLGMFPNQNNYPNLPYQFFTQQHLAYDLIYNPAETLFLKKAKHAQALCLNGLSMLHLQAEKSWQIWNE